MAGIVRRNRLTSHPEKTCAVHPHTIASKPEGTYNVACLVYSQICFLTCASCLHSLLHKAFKMV